jgi:hypothetical protein
MILELLPKTYWTLLVTTEGKTDITLIHYINYYRLILPLLLVLLSLLQAS